MNLDAMLKEGSLSDTGWYQDGMLRPGEQTFDPVEGGGDKDNDIKPEFELQSGYGDIEPNYTQMAEDGEGHTVDRNVQDSMDAGPVVRFARELMLQGKMGRDVLERMMEAGMGGDEGIWAIYEIFLNIRSNLNIIKRMYRPAIESLVPA